MTSPTDYEKLWDRGLWDGISDIGPQHRHCTRIIIDLVRSLRPTSFADVGCGDGATLSAVGSALGLTDLAGFDVSPAAIEASRRRIPTAYLEVVDIEGATPTIGPWDVVLSSQVIEHIEDDEAFLAGLRRMTGRYCIVATMQGRMRKSEPAIGHLRNYTRAGLEAKMRGASLEPIRVVEWGWPFYSPIYRSSQELFGGNRMTLSYGRRDRAIAALLYQLYRLNRKTKGDVLMIVGEAVPA